MSKKSTTIVCSFCCGLLAMAVAGPFLSPAMSVTAEGKSVKKEFINPSTMGFSNVVGVEIAGAKTLYISGQVGYGENGIPESIEDQADLAFQNIVRQLKDAGATVADVVKINAYIKNMDGPRTQAVGAAKAKYFTQDNQPASTWVGVTGLVYPNLLVEIEAIAVIEGS